MRATHVVPTRRRKQHRVSALRERGYEVFAVNPNGNEVGITVIDGGCPLMFAPTADVGHKVMRCMFTVTGKVPKQV